MNVFFKVAISDQLVEEINSCFKMISGKGLGITDGKVIDINMDDIIAASGMPVGALAAIAKGFAVKKMDEPTGQLSYVIIDFSGKEVLHFDEVRGYYLAASPIGACMFNYENANEVREELNHSELGKTTTFVVLPFNEWNKTE